MGVAKKVAPEALPVKKKTEAQQKNEPFFAARVQPKAKVTADNSALEAEADRVADQVIQLKGVSRIAPVPAAARLQSKAKPGAAAAAEELDLEAALGNGIAFAGAAKEEMEAAFGAGFADVQLHTDANAVQLAETIGARAFTYKNHIFFNQGEYNTHTVAGRRLLAHELTHVVQQRGNAEGIVMKWSFRKVNNVIEEKILQPNELLEVFVENFDLPKEKGQVLALYTTYIANNQLFSQVDLGNANNKRTFIDKRSDPTQLVRKWKDKVQWDNILVDKLKGENRKLYFTVKASLEKKDLTDNNTVYTTWSNNIDHIIELQLGGSDGAENLQLLDKDPNQASGRDINVRIGEVASLFKSTSSNKNYKQLKVSVVSLNEVGSYPSINGFPFPLEDKLALMEKGKVTLNGKEYKFTAGANSATAIFEDSELKDGKESDIREDNSVNKSFARFVPLIKFNKITGASANKLKGDFNPQEGRKLPIQMDKNLKKNLLAFTVDTGRNIKSAGAKVPAMDFYYPYLSKGKITELQTDNGDIKGKAKIYPSVKFIKELDVEFSKDEFRIVKKIDIKSPLKGIKVTESDISLNLYPELSAQGRLGLLVGNEKKPVMKALLQAGANADGFFAKGDAEFFIPNVDEAKGDISYKKVDGVYSLEANVSAKITAKNSKFLKGGDISASYKDGKIAASGNIDLDIPNTKDTKISVEYKNNNWLLKGKTTVSVPKLNDVVLNIVYDLNKNKLSGSGTTGFKYKSFNGTITLNYDGDRITGTGTLDVTKGKVKGSAKVKLNDKGKLSGEGSITVELKPGIQGTATITIDEQEKITVKGQVKVLKPYQLFPKKEYEKKLFEKAFTIPVPGLSIGPVGIVLEIKVGADFNAGIGPGELRDITVEAAFNPFEDDKNPAFSFSTKFNVNAYARLSAYIQAAIAIDALVADAKGGIRLTGIAQLNANVNMPFVAKYQNNVFAVEAEVNALIALILSLNIEGIVEAQVARGYLGHWEKRWLLKQFIYAPAGARLGMSLPIKYYSDKEFKVPGIDDIKITQPEIDAKSMLSDTMSKSGEQTEK